MRIEQYFLMTDYSLWEVILNGDSHVPTRIVKGVLQPVAPTTAEQRLAHKNELKAHGTLLMALLDKHQLKFNSHKDAKTLMEAIEKRFGLDQIHYRLQNLVSQLKMHGVSLSQKDVNLKFLRSLPSEWKTHTLIWRNKVDLEEQSLDDFTTGSISAAASVSATCAKLHASSLPNVDSLSNAVIYSFFTSQSTSPQLDNEDLKQIDVDDLEEMDLRWQMAMLTMRARRKGHFARKCRSSKDPKIPGAAEPQRKTVPTGLESVEARLLVYKQNESVFEENIKLLNIEVKLRDTTLATLRQKLDKAKKDRDDLKLKLEKFQKSSKNLTKLLASQTSEKIGLGYNSQVFTKSMFDCDNNYSSESDCESWTPSSLYDRFQPSGRYHAVPPPYTGTFMPPKPDLVFNIAPTVVETDHLAFNVQLNPTKPVQDVSHTTRPSASIIEDWFSNSETKYEPKAPQFVPSFAQSFKHVKSPRHTVQQIETPTLAATHVLANCDFHAKKMAQSTQRNYAHMGHHKQYAPLTHSKPQKHMVPTAVLTQSKPVSNTAVRLVSVALPNITVPRPRHAHHVVTKFTSPIRRHITRSPSSKTSNSPPKVAAA
nr:hypothetical protein [Tanacetum cinerariifolium]